MKDYLFVYRNDYKSVPPATAEQGQAIMQKWMNWLGDIAAKGRLTNQGNPLGSAGKVVRANNVITDGPYTEIKELIGGFSIVKADSFEEAAEMAKGCPILEDGGNVEVRNLVMM